MSFLTELKRRGVLKMAAAYALVSWILIEAGSVLLPTLFGASESIFRIYVFVVLIGFIIALTLAWIFEFSSDGIRLESKREESPQHAPPSNSRFLLLLVVLLAIALTISLGFNLDDDGDDQEHYDSIAVLPFTSISKEDDNVLFADGIHDDLLTKLANIDSLKVISRTSVLKYRDTTRNLREIGKELGVSTILEGSVQRLGNQVRVNMQLIDTNSDEHLWAEQYNRQLSAENLFAIQSEISSKVGSALRTELSGEELQRMDTVPTKNLDAYRLYTLARQNLHRRQLDSTQLARTQFTKALQLDPDYAEAHAGLAEATLLLQINHNEIPMREAYQLAQEALDQAFRLNPNFADAYAVRGLLKMQLSMASWNDDDKTKVEHIDAAAADFDRAVALNPSHAQAWMWYASLRSLQNRFDEAIQYNMRALEYDPIARVPYLSVPKLYSALGKQEKAIEEYLKAVELHSEWPVIFFAFADQLEKLGRLDEAAAWAERGVEFTPIAAIIRIRIWAELDDFERASALIEALPVEHPAKNVAQAFAIAQTDGYEAALDHLLALDETTKQSFPPYYDVLRTFAFVAGRHDITENLIQQYSPELQQVEFDDLRFDLSDAIQLAYIYLNSDRSDDVQNLLAKAQQHIDARPRLGQAGYGINDVRISLLLGNTEEALLKFQQAVDEGYIDSLAFEGWRLVDDPILQSIAEREEYTTQLDRIKLRKQAMISSILIAQETGDWQSLRDKAKL